MEFDKLKTALCEQVPVTFRDGSSLERDIGTYIECLTIHDGIVRFNKEAKRYGKVGNMERYIQAGIHKAIENIEKFQLYPYRTRKDSDTCYIGVPWDNVPVGEGEKMYGHNAPRSCDFRSEGNDSCRRGCGIEKSFFR